MAGHTQSAPVSLSLNEKEAASIPESELKKRHGVSDAGLSEEEAKKRQVQSGYNELPEARINPILKFLLYFWGPIPWMIEAAAVLSVVVKDWQDFGIILTLLVANAVVGFWEEHKADNTIAALKSKLAPEARVSSYRRRSHTHGVAGLKG
jgi:H+-transporting ATPase